MTVFLNPNGKDNDSQREDSQIYVCNPTILKCIPETGFCDLKEGFIPTSIKNGLTIKAASLPHDVGHYRSWRDYIVKLKSILVNQADVLRVIGGFSQRPDNLDLWVGSNVHVSEKAKIFGPVVMGDNTTVADDAMIFGPAVIGGNVKIGPGCLIEESVLWDHVTVGPESRIRYSLIDYKSSVSGGSEISNQLVPFPQAKLQRVINKYRQKKLSREIREKAGRAKESQGRSRLVLEQVFQENRQRLIGLSLIFLLLVSLILSYWKPTLKSLLSTWLRSDEYSSGLLVPIIAVYVLWLRRRTLGEDCYSAFLMGFGVSDAGSGNQIFRTLFHV